MGITGLLPFLQKASEQTHIGKIKRNAVVAVDAYCYLHKGAFACSDLLCRGEYTNIHILYCLKYVKMLLSHGLTPILVFDGRHLPAKELTEKKRRETRKHAKQRAAELLRLGKLDEARSFFRRGVDITHEMALQLIKECRKLGVDSIVAPYEADGQLAYLNLIGIADYIVTEDSDLILFGCKKIIFKLDLNGNCVLVDADKLHIAMGCRLEKFKFEKFRIMCILSGCDYLDSLPGIGLSKSCKFVLKTEDEDLKRVLLKIPAYLNMRHLEVTEEYIDNFFKAHATFMHMLVYDPLQRKLVHLTDPKSVGTEMRYCTNAGTFFDNDTAFQLALGNLDPFTLKQLDDWSPDTDYPANEVNKNGMKKKRKSIWSQHYKPSIVFDVVEKNTVKHIQFRDHPKIGNTLNTSPSTENDNGQDDLLKMYGLGNDIGPPQKKQKIAGEDSNVEQVNENVTQKKHNPFSVKRQSVSPLTTPTKISKDNCSLLKKCSPVKRVEPKAKIALNFSKFIKNKTVIDCKQEVLSRFFTVNHDLVRNEQSSQNESKDSKTIDNDVQKLVIDIKTKYTQNMVESSSIYTLSPEKDIKSESAASNSHAVIQTSDETHEISDDDETNDKKDLTNINLENFKFINSAQDVNRCQNNIDSIEGNDTSTYKLAMPQPNNKRMSKKGCRQPGLSKNKSQNPINMQSRLSMFGFKKKSI